MKVHFIALVILMLLPSCKTTKGRQEPESELHGASSRPTTEMDKITLRGVTQKCSYTKYEKFTDVHCETGAGAQCGATYHQSGQITFQVNLPYKPTNIKSNPVMYLDRWKISAQAFDGRVQEFMDRFCMDDELDVSAAWSGFSYGALYLRDGPFISKSPCYRYKDDSSDVHNGISGSSQEECSSTAAKSTVNESTRAMFQAGCESSIDLLCRSR